jgi:hypothetical protein
MSDLLATKKESRLIFEKRGGRSSRIGLDPDPVIDAQRMRCLLLGNVLSSESRRNPAETESGRVHRQRFDTDGHMF